MLAKARSNSRLASTAYTKCIHLSVLFILDNLFNNEYAC